ncbi:MAG: creatininase family protein [Cypionkella sp.]|jgi:creatinine amidohydrolase|nr:creatininase family protein [Cypionkella sp.]
MKHRFWADYTARDFAALPRDKVIAVLPVGAVEQHGPHLPLSVDQAIVDGMVAAVIPRLPADLPVLFLPTMPVGKSNEHSHWPGTLTFSAATLMAMWGEIGDCVAAAGVRKLVILNSHGGQIAPMDIVARDLRIKHKMLVVSANWFAMGLPEGLISPEEDRHGIHAGDLETSVMLALRPDLVQMDQARDFVPQNARLAAENRLLGLTPAGRLAWMMQDINAAGAAGNATLATADKGQRAIDHAATQIVTLLREVHRMPLSFLDTKANPEAFA